MKFSKQHTLKTAVSCSGVGVHGGVVTTLTLRPGMPNQGVVFVRTDIQDGPNRIPARWDTVTETTLCTKISNAQGISVSTIEHLMAAFAGLGVDNAIVELDGPEVPIMDGSSAPFVALIEQAGLVSQNTPRQFLKVLKPVSIELDANRWARLMPYDGFSVEFDFKFDQRAPLAPQSFHLKDVGQLFKEMVSQARTFGYLEDVEKMRALGLAKGGSLENAVVLDRGQVLNEGGFRYQDECVRHKVLDAVGDLYLAGGPILGHFHGSQSGHALNNQLLRAVMTQPDAFAWVVPGVIPETPLPYFIQSTPLQASFAHG